MVSQLLAAYVRDRLSHGYSQAEVRQQFINRGWRESDVDAALQLAASGRTGQPAARPVFANKPAAQPSFQQPTAQPRPRERTLLDAPSYSLSVDTAKLAQVAGGLVAMLIVIGIAYVVFFQTPSSTRFEINVMSGQNPLDGAEVRAYDEGKLVGTAKTVKGVAVFTNLPPKILTFKISKPGYGEVEENYDTSSGVPAATEILPASANATNQTAPANATATPTATPLPAPVISSVSINASNASAVIKWSTNTATNSTVLYGMSAAYNQSAGQNDAATAHSVTLSALAANRTYYYKIVGCTNSGAALNCSYSPGSFVTVIRVTAPTCSGTPINECIPGTGDKCIADQIAGAVPYPLCSFCGCPSGRFCTAAGTCASATPTPTPTATSTPSCTVGGSCGTTNCPTGYSGSCTQYYSSSCSCQACTPTCTLQAPTISSRSAGGITGTGAAVSWTTNQNSNSSVFYGTTTSYGLLQPISDNVTSHIVTLSGLSSGTLYHYRVQSCNSAGCTNSSDATFITTGAATVTGLILSPQNPVIDVGNGQQFAATVYWSNGTTTTAVTWSPVPTTSCGSLDSGGHFTATTGGTCTITATNTISNTTTVYVPVTPSISSGPSAATTSTGATITWATDIAGTSRVYYGATASYGSLGGQPDNVTSHSASLTGLSSNTPYHYLVQTCNYGSCVNSSDNTFTTNAAALNALVILPSSISVSSAPWTQSFTASASYDNGTSGIDVTSASSWYSTNTTVGSMAGGTFTGTANGTTTIYAVYSSFMSTQNATVTVTNQP